MSSILVIPSKHRTKEIPLTLRGDRAFISEIIDCYMNTHYILDWIVNFASEDISISPNQQEQSHYDLILVIMLESRRFHIPLVKTKLSHIPLIRPTKTYYLIRDNRHYWTLRLILIDFELATRDMSISQKQYEKYCIEAMTNSNSDLPVDSDFKYTPETEQICPIDSNVQKN
jgi:hypothetical protein